MYSVKITMYLYFTLEEKDQYHYYVVLFIYYVILPYKL